MTEVNCPICGQPAAALLVAQVERVDWKILGRIQDAHPAWNPAQGLCPVCVQDALDAFRCAGHDLHEIIYRAEMTATDPGTLVEPAALPIPLRLQANPRYTGQGVC